MVQWNRYKGRIFGQKHMGAVADEVLKSNSHFITVMWHNPYFYSLIFRGLPFSRFYKEGFLIWPLRLQVSCFPEESQQNNYTVQNTTCLT